MMKKLISIILSLAISLICVACDNQEIVDIAEDIEKKPETAEMKMICELAVMECYYHNVAKYFEKDAEKGFFGIGKKDKCFWIEYSGVVKLGVKMEKVNIDVEEDIITIALPEAEVLDCRIDSNSLTKDSFIVDKKSANVTADDELKAFNEAQAKLEEVARNDKMLLENARNRVKILLENYINEISEAIGKQYEIKWVTVEENENTVHTTNPDSTKAETAATAETTAESVA